MDNGAICDTCGRRLISLFDGVRCRNCGKLYCSNAGCIKVDVLLSILMTQKTEIPFCCHCEKEWKKDL